MLDSYINFFPQSNLFYDFPLSGRRYWLAEPAADCPEWAGLQAVLPENMSAAGSREGAALLLATSTADNALQEIYRRRCGTTAPRSFVMLLADQHNPTLWLGGVTAADLAGTIRFVRDYLTFLREKILAAGDFHVHSRVSDGWGNPEDLPALAVAARLDILALTDHNTTAGYDRLQKAALDPSLLTLRGMEVTDSQQNHLLAFGDVEGLPHRTPEELLQAARSGRAFLAQAHATSSFYFTDLAAGCAMGTEAWNYLSSAPEQARDYLRRQLQAGTQVAALGNSDTHLLADLGKARTFLRLEEFSATAVLTQLQQGACCAFCRGEFLGEAPLEKTLRDIYQRSDLLEGKLVTSPGFWRDYTAGTKPSVQLPGVQELTECGQRQSDRRQIYCPVTDECLCREHYFRLPDYQPGAMLRSGESCPALLTVNGRSRRVLLQTGEGENLRTFLHRGNNALQVDALPEYPEPLRLCRGRELREWEIRRPGEEQFQRVEPAGNLQIQGVVPPGPFAGEMLFRTRIDNPLRSDRLFFESVDGNIRLLVNGQEVARRFGTHWEERFEVEIMPEPELEIVVVMRNHVGLCGISNRVYLGTSQSLRTRELSFSLDEVPDFCELRWCEQRTRSFLLSKDFRILDCFFNSGHWQHVPAPAAWLMAADFSAAANPRVQYTVCPH